MSFVPPVYQKGSVLMFTQALPPLPPGYSIAPTGIPSYLLTKEEAANNYYDKTTSDGRFINEAGDYFPGEIFMVPTSGGRFIGVRYETEVDIDLKTGFAWKNEDSTPLIIGWFSRKGLGTDSTLEIALAKEDASSPVVLSLKTDGSFTTTKPRAGQFATANEFLTGTSGIKKDGDTIKGGIYYFQAGKIYLQSLTDVEDSYRTVAILNFQADGVTDIIDLQGNYIVGSGLTPTEDTHLIPKGFLDIQLAAITTELNNYTTLTERERVINKFSGFDAIIQSTDDSYGEYTTAKTAILAGKRRIKIASGTYTASTFWPTGSDAVDFSLGSLLIEGDKIATPIISGNSFFGTSVGSGYPLSNITFKNIIFKGDSGTLFEFTDFGKVKNVVFENCQFIKNSTSPAIGLRTKGSVIEDNVFTVKNCYFIGCDIAISVLQSGLVLSPYYVQNLKIVDSYFSDFATAIDVDWNWGIVLERNDFKMTRASSIVIDHLANDFSSTAEKMGRYYIQNNIFDVLANTCKVIDIIVNTGTTTLNGGNFLINNNVFRALSGVTTPYSIYLTSNASIGNHKYYISLIGNEFYNFTAGSQTGISVAGAAGAILTAIFKSGFSSITDTTNFTDFTKSNIII